MRSCYGLHILRILFYLFCWVCVVSSPVLAIDWPKLFSSKQSIWNLPKDLDDFNTVVEFTLETSVHTVHGSSSEISGRVWLDRSEDFSSVKATVNIPVHRLVTGNGSRDKRMWSVLGESDFPNIIYTLYGVRNICNPVRLSVGQHCAVDLLGKLKIKGTSKAVRIPVTVARESSGFIIKGRVSFGWSQFGIEDPSTFLAKVHDDVEVTFSCRLANP